MKRLSPSCQQLVSEKFDDALSKSKIIIRSALADRELAPIVMVSSQSRHHERCSLLTQIHNRIINAMGVFLPHQV